VTPVRSKRSRTIHATGDLRRSYCGRKVDGWLVEPDTAVTCSSCIRVAQDIEANGN
jgi:hypothetical protein